MALQDARTLPPAWCGCAASALLRPRRAGLRVTSLGPWRRRAPFAGAGAWAGKGAAINDALRLMPSSRAGWLFFESSSRS